MRPDDKAKLISALRGVRDQLIIGRRILVSDWPPHHKQAEYELQLTVESGSQRIAEDDGLIETSGYGRVIH